MIYLGTCEFVYVSHYFYENNKIYSKSFDGIKYITYSDLCGLVDSIPGEWVRLKDIDISDEMIVDISDEMIVDENNTNYRKSDITLSQYLINRIECLIFDKL